MALDTYNELKTAVAQFLNRDDLTAIIPTFVELAEAQIQRDLRHWRMEERVTASISTQYLTRPSDWLETVRVTINNPDYRELRLISMSDLAKKRRADAGVAGVPQFFCHSQDEIEIYPAPSEATTIELIYTKSVPPLTDSATSNWLLATAPDVYLYGSLLASSPYLHEDARATTWASLYGAAVKGLNRESVDAQFSSQTLVMGSG